MGSGNWIVDNLNSALQTWNDKLAEIWTLISTTPEDFKGGGIWNVIVSINGALQAIGYALLVLFFVMGVVKTCGSFTEIKRPEVAFKCFIRFVLAQAAVTYGNTIHGTRWGRPAHKAVEWSGETRLPTGTQWREKSSRSRASSMPYAPLPF